ncbi:DHH family phosphoesterase [Paenibacillus sp. N1-5-1-14]|uniref:DHH family phosphoesterase n=1 Tax=Paenibacillus radicibacter TaxID=2972488 RepID=UPI002158F80C|nr:DHH family phosphoesterase [Paenibacillus radicibacter]MCR8642986.1 DHH family phosphoesterase [Paenibacillus radicibacter]
MPKFLVKRWHGQHILWIFGTMLLLIAVLCYYQWVLGVLFLLIGAILLYVTIAAETAFRKDLNYYIASISHRVRKAGSAALNELPIGILIYDEESTIQWHNSAVAGMLKRTSAIGEDLIELIPDFKRIKDKDETFEVTHGNRIYAANVKVKERVIYFRDVTDYTEMSRRYEADKTVVGILMMDNWDELTQGMDDQTRSVLLAKVMGEINNWAIKHDIYLRRLSSDRYLVVMNQKSLKALEQTRFGILDDVRDMTMEYKIPLTISIGIASGEERLIELGQMAQASLDMALGRGGDQVAVKTGQKLCFYGGRSNAIEKRTRVRARVISHALRDLIKESDKVIIMGHRFPDMDAIGAAIGVLKAVRIVGKEGYIVLEGMNPSIQRLMETIADDEKLHARFITPDEALQIMNPRTLAVVCDTHKASMVAEPRLLSLTHRIVVIDHHRRSEDFLQDATLVYMEPYASSTCELVTELLQYITEKLTLEVIEATVLLAGIVVDTKSFTQRTGSRTFEAASFLRRNGADATVIQTILKEDLGSYIEKAEIIKHTEIVNQSIALAIAKSGRMHSQLMIAQVADTLLGMTGILASFVIARRPDGLIGISARSMGDLNVQVVMERLGGGGHLTNAATQLEGTLEDAELRLKQAIQEIEEEEGLFE